MLCLDSPSRPQGNFSHLNKGDTFVPSVLPCLCGYYLSGCRRLRSPGQDPCLDIGEARNRQPCLRLCMGFSQAAPHLKSQVSVWVSEMNWASGILIGDCLLVDLHGRLTAHSSPLLARDFQEKFLQANVAPPGYEPSLSLPFSSLPPSSHSSHVEVTHAGSLSPCQEQPEDCLDKAG